MIPRTPPPIFWRGSLALAPPISTVWKYDHFISSQAPKKKKTSHPIPSQSHPPPSQHCHVKTSRSRPRLWQIGQRANDLLDLETVVHMPQQQLQHLRTKSKKKKHRWRSESDESNPGWLKKSYRGRKSNLIMDGLLMISDDDRMDRWTAEMTYPQ